MSFDGDDMPKKYYWLKFQKDFFSSLRIKRLRRLAGGDTFTIIYLKLQLLAMTSDGYLEFKGVGESFEDEMALDIDEDIDNVKITINYLLSCDLMKKVDEKYFLPYVAENTGSETASAERVRNFRERQKVLTQPKENGNALHCNTDVTEMKHFGNVEKEKEKEKEKDIYIDDFFEKSWKQYPKKQGKGQISKTKKKKLYNEVGLEQMLRCIERYKETIQGKDFQYVMHGSTFFNSGYVDYLDENYQSVDEPKQVDNGYEEIGGRKWQV